MTTYIDDIDPTRQIRVRLARLERALVRRDVQLVHLDRRIAALQVALNPNERNDAS